ncbi:MAG: DUF4062 domain-containing protein [Vicinamibacteria bacterium]
MESVNVLKLFIASPGDVKDERARVREVVLAVNRSMGRTLGIQVDVYGWEDIPPAAGRAQEIINPDVDVCDIFVGILWKRWGQATGKASSGFEEEFQRAFERMKATARPSIWMGFKQLTTSDVEDPGEQLRHVLAFRETQQSHVLYKTFVDGEDWERQFRSWLEEHVLKCQAAATSPSATNSASAAPAEPPPPASVEAVPSKADLPPEFSRLATIVANALGSPSPQSHRTAIKALSRAEVSRLLVWTKAISASRFAADTLGVHDVNLLFLDRTQIDLSGAELQLVLRTLIGDAANRSPGWYWFTDATADQAVAFILGATVGAPEEISVRGFDLLRHAAARSSDPAADKLVRKALLSSRPRVVKAAAAYVRSFSDPEFARALPPRGKNDDVEWTRLVLDLNRDSSGAIVQFLRQPTLVVEDALSILVKHRDSIDSEGLREGLGDTRDWLREFAADTLSSRDLLLVGDAEMLLKDAKVEIRAIAVKSLLRRERSFTDLEINELLGRDSTASQLAVHFGMDEMTIAEIVQLERLEAMTNAELEREIDWFSGTGALAYQTLLGRDFRASVATIREDIQTRFQRVYQASVARIRSSMEAVVGTPSILSEVLEKLPVGKRDEFESTVREDYGRVARSKIEESVKQVETSWASLRVGVEDRYLRAALHLLASHPDGRDREIALSTLSRKGAGGDLLRLAIAIVANSGSQKDVDQLLPVIESSWGSVRKAAIAAALRLSPGANGALPSLLSANDKGVVSTALDCLEEDLADDFLELVYPKLRDKNDRVRIAALQALARLRGQAGLKGLLDRYLEDDQSYYYDVVCWLDRLISAPAAIQPAYRKELEQV